jgi:hypothetical protein
VEVWHVEELDNAFVTGSTGQLLQAGVVGTGDVALARPGVWVYSTGVGARWRKPTAPPPFVATTASPP